MEQVLSMEEPKQKLAKLEELVIDANVDLYYFGHYLAGCLNNQLSPMGFVLQCELALYDLQRGVNGYNRKPINNRLVGRPKTTYIWLHMLLPVIARAVFPMEFATIVNNHISQLKGTH